MKLLNAKTGAVIGLACGVPALALLGGCESIERETGLSRQTQTGAAAGAAAGGIIALIAGANPAWIAASTILGGAAGGVIAEYLNRKDAETHASNQYRALETLGEGETKRWSNPETGHTGSTTVNDVFTMADGTVCKNFTEVIEANGRTFRETGTACKSRGGDWEVRSG